MDIALGYEDSDTPIFSWENPEDSDIPVKYCKYVSFSNLGNYLVGLNFPCECNCALYLRITSINNLPTALQISEY